MLGPDYAHGPAVLSIYNTAPTLIVMMFCGKSKMVILDNSN